MRLSFQDDDDAAPVRRDWSQVVLTGSIVLSLSMVLASICIRFGIQLAEGNRLKRQGVAVCIDMRHPPGVETRDPIIADECAQLVERNHSTCLDVARAEETAYKKQRYPYAACIMSAWPFAQAAR
jgi:hypothetical protein